jgi:hypothetical protein
MLVPPVATAPETPKKTTWWEEEGWIEEPSPALRKLVMEGIAAHKRGEGHVYTTMEDLEARLGLCSK